MDVIPLSADPPSNASRDVCVWGGLRTSSAIKTTYIIQLDRRIIVPQPPHCSYTPIYPIMRGGIIFIASAKPPHPHIPVSSFMSLHFLLAVRAIT